MGLTIKTCKHCGERFTASCGKEEFCTDKCKLLNGVQQDANGCWNWRGTKDEDGYGYVKAKGGVTIKAHRLSYLLLVGSIDKEMVMHKCDNPSCINPQHLMLGTAADNKHDSVSKSRHSHGAAHYKSKLDDEKVLEILSSSESAPSLAARFGVTKNMIYYIKRGKSWKHLQP